MKTIKFVLAAALIGTCGLALADYNGSRDERMQSALDNYHNSSKMSGDSRNPSPGPAARTEESMKRGARNAGQAIKHGAQRVGHAVSTGLHKTGEAMTNAGRKMKSKVGTGSSTTTVGQKPGQQ